MTRLLQHPNASIIVTLFQTLKNDNNKAIYITYFSTNVRPKRTVKMNVYPPMCNMSLVMRKPAFFICKNKDADQLRSNREADQRLCFRYTDSTIPLLSIYVISSL